ncbi:MAG: AI-2E family transporter [Oscillospiraceae bacterium]|jgi:sporulation integral membrane protein YtvI|nr:AI-2E family transporter [Oscillospiraceae bacterium]
MVKTNIWIRRAAALVLAFLAVRFLSPFIIALGVSAAIEPCLRRVRSASGLRRGFVSAAGVLAVYGGAGAAVLTLCWRGLLWLYELAASLPSRLASLPSLLRGGSSAVERFIVSAPEELQTYLRSAAEGMRSGAESLPGRIYERVLSLLGKAISSAPGVVFFFTAAAIGTFFISSGYDEVRKFIWRQVPEEKRLRVRDAVYASAGAVKHWLLAELTLSAVCFAELLMFFFILNVRQPVFGALAAAMIDALPLVGTGVILVPWAMLSLISGETTKAVVLLAAYVTVAAVRSLLEPKLLGERSGPHPAASLIAIYLGFRLIGVWGMVLFPLLLTVLKRLNDGRFIRLWK